MSFVLLGILNSQAAGAAQAYFLSVLGGASDDVGNSVAIDQLDNIYVVGTTDSAGAGDDDFLLAKYEPAVTVEWQRTLGGSGRDRGFGIAADSANNVYSFGDTTSEGGNDFLLAKYDSSGTIQWQRILGTVQPEKYSVAIDQLDNIYVVGTTDSAGAGDDDFLLAKYNSAGTIQWQRTLGGSGRDRGFGIAADSANNVYVTGFSRSTDLGFDDALLAKYNSAGTIQWQRVFGGSGGERGESLAVDSSDNVYLVGQTQSTGEGNNDALLAKYNSAGTIQWQRVLGGAGDDRSNSVAIDSSDNVYLLGFTTSTGAGSNDFLLAKYDSSGSIQWQRVLGGAGFEIGHSVAIDSADNVYVLGVTESTGAGSRDFLLAKLPNDGSLEGTYSLDGNNIVYQASSLTAATSSLTDATSSLTSSTASLTSATSTLTDASASLTVVTEEI